MLQKTYVLNDLDMIARDIINYCTHKTILFYGEMGAGKTTLIKKIIEQLGSTDQITSPTFSIVNEYEGINKKPIYHFDFYRIESEKDVEQLGLDDYFNSEGWIFIEWPENINKHLPNNTHSAELKSINNVKRLLRVV